MSGTTTYLDPTTYYGPDAASGGAPAVTSVNPTLIDAASSGMGGAPGPATTGPDIDLSGLGHAISNFPTDHPVQFDLNLASIGLGAALGIPGGPLGMLTGAALGAGKAIIGDVLSAAASALGITDFLQSAGRSATDFVGLTTPDTGAPSQGYVGGVATGIGPTIGNITGTGGGTPLGSMVTMGDITTTGTSGTSGTNTSAGGTGTGGTGGDLSGAGGAAGPSGAGASVDLSGGSRA